MASRDSESNPDSPQAIDVASVSIENESEVEQGRGRRKPRKMKEWGSVSSKVKRNLGQSYTPNAKHKAAECLSESEEGRAKRLAANREQMAAARSLESEQVVSYVVYGKFPNAYYKGLEKLVYEVPKFYPGWSMRVHLNWTQDNLRDWACALACNNSHLDICDVQNLPVFSHHEGPHRSPSSRVGRDVGRLQLLAA
ncbi:hypothetical protein Pmani_002349 [Petrolisthes manimaculis]|uniref:Uncharacterized protein n=1 Tax=Petrolisthes manimaculis TaxID=1843537 RepID=A0AAE1QIK9_9EUCA|nr:hypothetical protein Pmani_002349 [Petrolisthes manimaculis]